MYELSTYNRNPVKFLRRTHHKDEIYIKKDNYKAKIP